MQHGAVMATRPARAPLSAIVASHFLNMTLAVKIAAIEPAAAAVFVVTVIKAMLVASAAIVLPGLKPNQPSQRINTPSATRMILWPGMALGLPEASYLPVRGPKANEPTNANQAPTLCTTVEPAKSQKPRSANQPPPQIQ